MAWAWGKSGARGGAVRQRSAGADAVPTQDEQRADTTPAGDGGLAGALSPNSHANGAHALAPIQHQGPPDNSVVANMPPAQQPPPPLSPEAMQRAISMRRMAASFGDIVGLMMRSPRFKDFSLADLEWLVLPALQTGQCLVMEQTDRTGTVGPLAAILWARVSEDVEARLRSDGEAKRFPRLTPQEWTCGTRPWLVAATGDRNAVARLIDVAGRRVDQNPIGNNDVATDLAPNQQLA